MDSAQWKFLQHQRSMTDGGSQSLTFRINNDDLLLPDDFDDDAKEEEQERTNTNKRKERLNLVEHIMKMKTKKSNKIIQQVLLIQLKIQRNH